MALQEKILCTAIKKILIMRGDSSREIKDGFSQYVQDIEKTAYEVYLQEQKKAGEFALKEYMRVITRNAQEKKKILVAVANSFEVFDKFFLSLSQSRKARAGSTFERIIKDLFKRLDYPFDEHEVINGQPDFLLPSRSHYDRNPMDCIIFTVKRTIRERWRQIVTEGTRGLGFFLATIDNSISKNQLDEMMNHRIYLVVPAPFLDENEVYRDSENVIDFETFFTDYLDPTITRWQKRRR